jgi:hypothetical protein
VGCTINDATTELCVADAGIPEPGDAVVHAAASLPNDPTVATPVPDPPLPEPESMGRITKNAMAASMTSPTTPAIMRFFCGNPAPAGAANGVVAVLNAPGGLGSGLGSGAFGAEGSFLSAGGVTGAGSGAAGVAKGAGSGTAAGFGGSAGGSGSFGAGGV